MLRNERGDLAARAGRYRVESKAVIAPNVGVEEPRSIPLVTAGEDPHSVGR